MDWGGWAVFGLVATTLLTTVMIVFQLGGRTRLDLPLMLGTMVLCAIVPLLPGIHPRMASERAGPSSNASLEPPGLLALSYGADGVAGAGSRHTSHRR